MNNDTPDDAILYGYQLPVDDQNHDSDDDDDGTPSDTGSSDKPKKKRRNSKGNSDGYIPDDYIPELESNLSFEEDLD